MAGVRRENLSKVKFEAWEADLDSEGRKRALDSQSCPGISQCLSGKMHDSEEAGSGQ